MRVGFEYLKPGMKLAGDLLEPGGRLLLPRGTELSERHLRYFQIWGIAEAELEGGAPRRKKRWGRSTRPSSSRSRPAPSTDFVLPI
jgi:hypothetical protein